jgi:transitional endoplasmic reticulum ATPase
MRHPRPTPPNVRPYQPEDLSRILRLFEQADEPAADGRGLTLDQAVDLIGSSDSVTLVAELEGEIVGMALGSVSGPAGWIHRLLLLPELDGAESAKALLEQLEPVLVERGARKVGVLVAADDRLRAALEARGYEPAEDLAYFERQVPATVPVPAALAGVQGRMVEPGLWDRLKGLDEAKQIIERRVILPLAEPDLAARHAVSPPKAIVLFGPPGTGKTTFAQGIASRLGWPFVEIQPSELAGEGPEGQARLLAQSFERILELPAAVVFVDEVEDLASIRHEQRRVSPSVTNEFLRQIPRLREAPGRLLVCATNWVRRLDHAFLRPGRFDYVLPVGPPDAEARRAIWTRYTGEITDEEIDVDLLVDESDLFTPADIEFAARKAAQHAFEREHFEGERGRATTNDFRDAIRQTKPSLSEEIVGSFEEDTQRFARY